MEIKKTIKALIFLLTLTATVGIHAQQDTRIDGVAAIVGKNIVKYSDIENAFLQLRMKQGYDNAFDNRCSILEQLLITKLLIHKGEIDSVEISDDEVEQQVQYYLKNYIRQYGSKEALRAATGYTYDEFKEIYTNLIRDRLLSQRVEYNLTQGVKTTPAEVSAYFNRIPQDSIPMIEAEYEIGEIQMAPEVSQEERERVRMELAQLRERVLKGESFSMLATLYSEDPGSAKKGGELGFFTRGDMTAPFEAAAFALKPGEVSPIIETQFGFHIIQLIERRGNSINARHILLMPQVSSTDLTKARMKLDSIAILIRNGNISFEEAAHEYSTTKTNDGRAINPYTGTYRFSQSMLRELYPNISIANMDQGSVSNATVMTTDDGKSAYRIVQLQKKIPEHKTNLTDDYDKIYNAALQEAKNDKLYSWAARMIKTTFIKVSDEYKDCHFRLDWTKTK